MAERHCRKPNRGPRRHGFNRSLPGGRRWVRPEYGTWLAMVQRCTNPNNPAYKHYGGRGIAICDRWLGPDGPVHFFTDMGPKPDPLASLDRIDNDKGYGPENCRWATRKEQANNRRSTRLLEWEGRSFSLAKWSELTGLLPSTILLRLKAGWPLDLTLSTPPRRKRPDADARRAAQLHVNRAVMAGRLPCVKTRPCDRCGKAAAVYHHHQGHDREHWLDVLPLCRYCWRLAVMAGPACRY